MGYHSLGMDDYVDYEVEIQKDQIVVLKQGLMLSNSVILQTFIFLSIFSHAKVTKIVLMTINNIYLIPMLKN